MPDRFLGGSFVDRVKSSTFVEQKEETAMRQLTLRFENATVMNRLIKVIELMKGVSIVEVVSTPKKSGLDAALEDVKEGRVYKAESTDDLFKQILG